MTTRGYTGVAIYHPKKSVNVGSLWRTAQVLGCDFLATIGKRYEYQSTDTMGSVRHTPLLEFESFDAFEAAMPKNSTIVGVEMCEGAPLLEIFDHPERAVYLFGAEDYGIPPEILKRCKHVVRLRGERSLNLAVAGSIVLYARTTP